MITRTHLCGGCRARRLGYVLDGGTAMVGEPYRITYSLGPDPGAKDASQLRVQGIAIRVGWGTGLDLPRC